jgi:hypothetical protein
VPITLSPNIDAPTCPACTKRRPWAETITLLEAEFTAHEVIWPAFRIIHGKDLPCADPVVADGREDGGLYVIAVDPNGDEAKEARVFARKAGHYVGVSSVLDGSAFRAPGGAPA